MHPQRPRSACANVHGSAGWSMSSLGLGARYRFLLLYEPQHNKTNKMTCVPTAQQRLWSDWVDAQADLSLSWAHKLVLSFSGSIIIYTWVKVSFTLLTSEAVGRIYLTSPTVTILLKHHPLGFIWIVCVVTSNAVVTTKRDSYSFFSENKKKKSLVGLWWHSYDYHNHPKFSDIYAWANSADPDQTAPRGAVWSGSTLFAIPSASFGLITLWLSHIV